MRRFILCALSAADGIVRIVDRKYLDSLLVVIKKVITAQDILDYDNCSTRMAPGDFKEGSIQLHVIGTRCLPTKANEKFLTEAPVVDLLGNRFILPCRKLNQVPVA